MKLIFFLFLPLLLTADEFALVQPISVEISPSRHNNIVEEKAIIPKDTTIVKPIKKLPPLQVVEEKKAVVTDINNSKKQVKNEVIAIKVLKITFESSSSIITPSSSNQLKEFADYLKKNKSFQVVIYGYTDSIGDDRINLNLSQKRAKSVTTALNSLGIRATRLTAVGMGKKDPVASNETSEGRAQNRRIEALIIQ